MSPCVELPYVKTEPSRLDCRFEGMDYYVKAEKGSFGNSDRNVFRINSEENRISLDFSGRE